MFAAGYGVVLLAMFFVGALAFWDAGTIFWAANLVTLACLPMVAAMIYLTRREIFEALAVPEGKPDYTWGQNMEHQNRWADAVDHYRKVHAEFPLDAESLFRIATIFRDRLDDEDQYLATLSAIVQLPDDATPGWILLEARDRLVRLADADPSAGPTFQRPTEIELPDDDRDWGQFGPED